MEYRNWLKFASFQNGQNIRLNNLTASVSDCLEVIERLHRTEMDEDRRSKLNEALKLVRGLEWKLNAAIEKNNLLKEIVVDDFYNSGRSD